MLFAHTHNHTETYKCTQTCTFRNIQRRVVLNDELATCQANRKSVSHLPSNPNTQQQPVNKCVRNNWCDVFWCLVCAYTSHYYSKRPYGQCSIASIINRKARLRFDIHTHTLFRLFIFNNSQLFRCVDSGKGGLCVCPIVIYLGSWTQTKPKNN